MTKSTIENVDTVNVESIPLDNLKDMLEGIDREIESLQQDRQMVLSELKRRGEKYHSESSL